MSASPLRLAEDRGADIPLIDFGSFLRGSPDDRKQIASDVDAALSSTGFIYLSNHGLEQCKIDTCFEWSKRYFALSDYEKRLASSSLPQSHDRGYLAVGEEKVRGQIPMKESFDFGNPDDEGQGNNWPPQELLPGFRNFMEDFFKDCAKLTYALFECLSLALNLSSHHGLNGYHARSLFSFSLLHYPAISAQLLQAGNVARNPAHSDLGTLTLLFQDNCGGLEIADMSSTNAATSAGVERSGRFRHVNPKPGTIVINVGYLLMRWSNGRWKNTIHRVSEPPHRASEGGMDKMIPERYSIAFFSDPDPTAVVEALPGCWNDEVPKRWGPIEAGEYLRRKTAAIYS